MNGEPIIRLRGVAKSYYREALEMTGQVRGLHYLKQCRGGAFVSRPMVSSRPAAM